MNNDNAANSAPPAWVAGGGQSGALIRSIAWEGTSLGALAQWPVSLKTTVGILLHARQPMFLWWGPDLIQFYNDAYLPSFGVGKHPAAMGQAGRACWPEIWPIISRQIEDVMERGIPSWNEDQLVPILRNHRIEEVYWTYGYSPVLDERGRVGGTLVVCTETTPRVVSARRQQILRALTEKTEISTDLAATLRSTAKVLGTADTDLPFSLIFSPALGSPGPQLLQTVAVSPEEAAANFGADFAERLPALVEACRLGHAHRLEGPGLAGGPWPEAATDIYVAPLTHAGSSESRGFAVFGLSPRLPFNDGYREFLEQIASHLGLMHARIESLRTRAAVERERDDLLRQAPVPMAIMTGADHVFQLANPLYCQMVGREVEGKTYAEAFPEIVGTSLPGMLDRVFQTGQPFVSEEQLVPLYRDDGVLEERFFRFNLEAIRDAAGSVYGMMACTMDITAQVRERRTMEKVHEEREALLTQLEAANRSKDEFLAMLGHELRNPLSPIVTALQLMKRQGSEDTIRERNVIERQVQHLVRLVDDLLDVSKITRGKVDLKREVVELSAVLGNAIEVASVLLEQHTHTLSIDVAKSGLLWEGDPVRLAQVVANLLTNAARYTPPGGHIRLAARRDGDELVISVTDNGSGISSDMLPRIFDLFVRGQRSVDRAAAGLGIGLTLAKTLVTLHGGTITAQSDGPGRGSSFVIRLPAPSVTAEAMAQAANRHAAAAADHVIPKSKNPQRILVVDDNVDAAEMLCEILRDCGHEVSMANDPIAALEMLERIEPSVAVMDIGMPVMDGYELAARMRQTGPGRRCRLIALTGYGQEHDWARSQQAGFAHHLVKPVEIASLLRALEPPV
jgi:PAS domain S-box-containing protein